MAASTYSEDGVADDIDNYYRNFDEIDIQNGFHDLDNPGNLGFLMEAIKAHHTRNFILDFSDTSARVMFDLQSTSIAALTNAPRPETISTRWINIWYPYQQQPLLEFLARRYDFSPRLLALMCSDPKYTRDSEGDARPSGLTRQKRRAPRARPSNAEVDLEVGTDELSELSSVSSHGSVAGGNLYRTIDDLWHYASVDFGRSYVCIGYNSLYGTKHANNNSGSGLLPHCKRVWTWLLLCEDQTVISINEDPFPCSSGWLDPLQQRIFVETRRNLVNVFRSLSKANEDSLMTHNPMTLLPIRVRLGDTPEESAHRESDAPGLLLYYLFENWHNSYTLVTRRESRFGVELTRLRAEMFEAPKLCHIDRLDGIGKELGVLKRHYESYNRIIDRLLEPPGTTVASLQNSHVISDASQASLETVRPVVIEQQSMLGVSLSSAARARFRRLKDLIDLYALSEVEEYVKQKDALITMNFNLIAIKESLDVERLTRITLLLTKITMLFLPVSLLSAYFSVPLDQVVYTVKEFWIAFAVTMVLSSSALFFFGVFSGSMQTTTFFVGLRKGMERARDWIREQLL